MRSAVWDGDYPVTQEWGCTDLALEPYSPDCASGHFHCGIDIGMPSGTLLRAARGGIVGYVSPGVLVVKVGVEADCYLHVDRSLVVLGQFVNAGEPVAYSGARIPSGGSLTGPHLHFEVQAGPLNQPSTSLDPRIVLQGGDEMANGFRHPEDADALIWRMAVISGVEKAADVPAEFQPYLNGVVSLADLKAEISGLKAGSAPAGPTAPAAGASPLDDLARQVFSASPDPVSNASRYGVMNQAQAGEYFKVTLANRNAAAAAGAATFTDFFGNELAI